MSFFPGNDPQPGDAFACDAIELMVIPNAKDIGGFQVRRALPTAKRRLVGPFIFFDRMGPAILRAGQALDVRPHPHIGLVDRHLSVRRQDQASRFARHRDGDPARRREPDDRRPRHRPFRAHAGGIARRADVDLRPADMAGAAGRQGRGRRRCSRIRQPCAFPRSMPKASAGRVVIGAFDGLRSPVAHRLGHALCRPPAGARRQRAHPGRCRGARHLHAGR